MKRIIQQTSGGHLPSNSHYSASGAAAAPASASVAWWFSCWSDAPFIRAGAQVWLALSPTCGFYRHHPARRNTFSHQPLLSIMVRTKLFIM